MAAEPEQKVDQWLKACAEKRRQQAGPPPELHPANRRLLQAEVARTYATPPSDAENKRRWLIGLWPRLAIAASALAAVALVSTVWWRQQSPTNGSLSDDRPLAVSSVPDADRKSDREAENEAAPQPALTANEEKKVTMEFRQQPVKRETTAMPGRPDEAFQSRERAAAESDKPASKPEPISPTPTQSRVQLREAGKAGQTAKNEPNAGRRYGLELARDEAAVAKQPTASSPVNRGRFSASAPSVAAPTAGAVSTDEKLKQVATLNQAMPRQQFVQSGDGPDGRSAQKAATDVLNNFVFENSGQQVRLVDQDGSAYEGSLVAVGSGAAKQTAADVTARIARPSSEAFNAAQYQSLPFRVEGVHRTSNQRVIFEGNYLVDSNFFAQFTNANAPAGPTPGVAIQNSQSNQQPQLQPRIEGKATIGRNNQIQINARPLGP